MIADRITGQGWYVGTYIALSVLQRYWWGEGEVKFYIDGDDRYPTVCGTGMEDYFGGSWSFAVQENGKTVEKRTVRHIWVIPIIRSRMIYLKVRIIMMTVRLCVDFTDGMCWILSFLTRI